MKKVFKLEELLFFRLKFDLKMKLTTLFLIVSLFQLQANESYAQKTKISLDLENVSIEQVLNKIEEKTKFKFLFNYSDTDYGKITSIRAKKEQVFSILERLLQNSDVTFQVIDKQIVIKKKALRPKKSSKILSDNLDESSTAIPQNSISGTIKDNSGVPLPGVSILIEGTTTGTQTDFDGNYTINAKKGDVLIFSYLGYKTQNVTVADAVTIDLQMEEEASALDEVVVVGYGVQKKEHLTSSVAVVDMEDVENRPGRSLGLMLTASVPNLNVNITSSAPNAEPSLNIRGFTGLTTADGAQTGEPLVLIDGFPQDIKNINPADVENISVLKDAAASAIYGSRAPNGVILITTKSGKKGSAMRINISSDVQISQPIGLPSQLNSLDYIDLVDRRSLNSGRALITADQRDRITRYINGEITTQNTINPVTNKYIIVQGYNANVDNFDAAYRDQVVNFRHNLDLSGGSEKTTYYASYSFNDQQGLYKSDVDFLKRNTAALRVRTDVTDFLTVGMNVRFSKDESERPRVWTANQNNDQVQNLNADATFFNSVSIAPYFPIWDDNGSPNQFSIIPTLDGRAGTFQNNDNDLWTKIDFEFRPLKGLTVTGDYAYNYRSRFSDITSFAFQTFDNDGTLVDSRRNPTQNNVEKISSNTNYHIANIRASYSFKIKDAHEFMIMAGYNEEENRFESITASNSEFYTTSIPALSGTFGDNTIVSDNIESFGIQGYFGRFNYNYKGKYLFEANGRYDASSRFSPKERWAFFPAFSAGWNVHLENFWPLKETVNRFKITGNWGEQGDFGTFGNSNNYPYIATIGTNIQTPVIINGQRPSYVTQPALLPSSLTWARPRTIGFGLDIGMFDNRLSAEYQWYQKTIYDQIGPALTLPETLGANAPITNSTVSETRGWELSLLWRDTLGKIYGDNLNYSIRAGVSDYIGYVVDYVEPNLTGTRGNNSYVPGQRFGELFGFTSPGLAQNFQDVLNNPIYTTNNFAYGPWSMPGVMLLEDTNGDGQIDDGQGNLWYAQGDRKRLGFTYPRYKYNIALSTNWKGLSLSVLLDGVGSQKRYVANKFTVGTRNHTSPYQVNDLGYWTSDNPDAFFPRANFSNLNQDPLGTRVGYINDRYVHNLAHLRIKNINLNYQLPKAFVNKLRLESIALNFSAENVGFIYNKMWNKELDPIMILAGATTYPPSSTFVWGIKVGI